VVDRAASILDRADPSNYDRLCMARAGSRMIADHPVTGVGLDQVEAAYENYREPEAVTRSPGHLHNNVVQIAAERGLVGLAAYVAILAVFGRSVWRTLRRRETSTDPAVAGALAAVVAITVFGLFEYTWGDAEVWIPTLACLAVPFALEGPA
jgi:O-antigen ligase